MPRAGQETRYRQALLSRAALARGTRRSLRSVDRWLAAGLPTRNLGAMVRVNPLDAQDWLRTRYGIDLDLASRSEDRSLAGGGAIRGL